MDRSAYLSSLPRKRVAAAALIRDERARVCVVKGNYRPDWHFPGGTIEADESPAAGCRRELLEELGLSIDLGRLLCVEWVTDGRDDAHGGLQLVYDGGVLPDDAIAHVVLPADELDDARFLAVEDALGLLSLRNQRRLTAGLAALLDGSVAELDRQR
ncbi:MAG TPA: NUDIX hydrolase [Microlunatus sp.]|nr:NUDIX hydrolase [Microlunatus sp.]